MNTTHNITILEKFKQFMVPLSTEEFVQLEENILREGCKDPLVVWSRKDERVLLDGHNRYAICTKHQLPFQIEELSFKSEDQATQWMINHQLGRRNLTPDQMSYYRGLKYLRLKQKRGGYDKVISEGLNKSTAEILAEEFKVGPATIRRDANYAAGVEIVGRSNASLRQDLLQGKTKIKKKDIQFLANLDIGKPRFKNEADLFNKLQNWKEEKLAKIEDSLQAVEHETTLTEAEMFPSYENRIKKIKGQILSYMNNAITHKDPEAIKKLREIIDQLEALVME